MTGLWGPGPGPGAGPEGRTAVAEPEVPDPDAAAAPAARPRIDPRFARRWTQVRREQGRRRLRIILAAVAVVVVAGLAAGSLYSPLLYARHVRITGPAAVSEQAVLAVSGLRHPRPLIEVDTRAVAARIDAVPSWGAAVVRRSWPTTVLITFAVRTPIAVVARTGPPGPATPGASGWAIVDASGRVLADVYAAAPGLPVIQGVGPVPAPGGWLEGSVGPRALPSSEAGSRPLVDLGATSDSPTVPTGTAAALALVAALPAALRAEVLSVTVGPGNHLSMSVLPASIASGSIPVNLGDGSQLAAKLTALATLLGKAPLSGVTGLDLTVPDRPAALTARQTPGTVSTHAGG